MSDKYTAVWVSHSSISDFIACPRAYYLNNVYKDPRSNKKISIISPPLALGQTVHAVLESLSLLPINKRFTEPLMTKFNKAWEYISGDKGGFTSQKEEESYKSRGQEMIRRVLNNPGPLSNLAVKINQDLPHYWLSKDDNIILCGKIDWLEYNKGEDTVHIIDFKTSKREESGDSLQLPIYYLLATNTQSRPVKKVSYWYLGLDDAPKEAALPDLKISEEKIMKIAKDIKLARALERFKCPRGESGCTHSRPYEAIIDGRATFVGTNDFNQDVYSLRIDDTQNSQIL